MYSNDFNDFSTPITRKSPRIAERKENFERPVAKKLKTTSYMAEMKVRVCEVKGICPYCQKRREEHSPKTIIPIATSNSRKNKINR